MMDFRPAPPASRPTPTAPPVDARTAAAGDTSAAVRTAVPGQTKRPTGGLRGRLRLAGAGGLALLFMAVPAFVSPPAVQAQGACFFQLGFKALRDKIPAVVAACLENEHFNVANGNAEQRTTTGGGGSGLMVWRKRDNWTAFTDGYRTWINGPFGLQQRLNTQRFPWENDPPAPQPTPRPLPQPQRAPPPAPVRLAPARLPAAPAYHEAPIRNGNAAANTATNNAFNSGLNAQWDASHGTVLGCC